MRWLYRFTMLLLLLPGLAWLLWRGWRQTGRADTVRERLGLAPAMPGGCIWLHAASVGEVQAAIPLVRELHERHPDQSLLVTGFTLTGRERARQAFEGMATVATVPWDLPWFVRLFVRRVRPRALVVLETEIWPELFRALGGRGIPIALVSARLGERTFRRYRRLVSLVGPALRQVDLVAAQSDTDAARYRELGAGPVRVTGNIKFDLGLPAGLHEQGEAVRMTFFPGRSVWVAASTREGEEKIILEALETVRRQHPETLLIIAPRYPERANEVAGLVEKRGFGLIRRSDQQPVEQDTAVFLLDTLGELTQFYAAGDLAFVGGSLVPVGGHNLLEPAALGLPVLTGPHVHNAPDIAAQLLAAGAAREADSAASLAAAVNELLADPELRDRMGRAARQAVQDNRGALRRTLEHLQPLIAGPPAPGPGTRRRQE